MVLARTAPVLDVQQLSPGYALFNRFPQLSQSTLLKTFFSVTTLVTISSIFFSLSCLRVKLALVYLIHFWILFVPHSAKVSYCRNPVCFKHRSMQYFKQHCISPNCSTTDSDVPTRTTSSDTFTKQFIVCPMYLRNSAEILLTALYINSFLSIKLQVKIMVLSGFFYIERASSIHVNICL